ncbi:MAG TPA: hypothetical protein VHP11_09345, partial [Tepidisphaeraceae bacterium]|nr:hypothetical protein [Tepidisphaeraceae bacterium]
MRQAGIVDRAEPINEIKQIDARRAGWRCVGAIGLVLSGALVAGCRSSNKPEGEIFLPEGQVRDVDRMAAAQAAAGARADAMLYPRHFDGGELNSLGQSKLHLMVADKPANQPLVVYLNWPADNPLATDRRGAVEKYLRDAGLVEEQIELKDGSNPEAVGSTEAALTRLPKAESGSGGAMGGTVITTEPPGMAGGSRATSK